MSVKENLIGILYEAGFHCYLFKSRVNKTVYLYFSNERDVEVFDETDDAETLRNGSLLVSYGDCSVVN